jgi:hypothetical protein
MAPNRKTVYVQYETDKTVKIKRENLRMKSRPETKLLPP